MRIELSWSGVASNRVYFATEAKQGRPRKTDAISKSRKPFATGATKQEAIDKFLDMVGFVPHDKLVAS